MSADAVLPTALSALQDRRRALQVVRDIEALVASNDDLPDHAPGHDALQQARRQHCALQTHQESRPRQKLSPRGPHGDTPGPGSYTPDADFRYPRHSASLAMKLPTGRRTRANMALSCSESERRYARNRGPGAYATTISDADGITKRRVPCTTFTPLPAATRSKSSKTRCKTTSSQIPSSPPTSPSSPSSPQPLATTSPTALSLEQLARAETLLSTHRSLKGAVKYQQPSTPSVRSEEQAERVRRLLLNLQRQPQKIGFYHVKYALTERRTGSIGVLSMAQSARSHRSSKSWSRANTTRRFVAWKPFATLDSLLLTEQAQQDGTTQSTIKAANSRSQTTGVRTHSEQWHRARTQQLLREKELRRRIRARDSQHPSSAEPARHASTGVCISKQHGRDTVRCPRKQLRVVTQFQHPITSACASSSHRLRAPAMSPQRSPIRGHISFAKTIGRSDHADDATHGDAQHLGSDTLLLDLAPSDALTQPRPRAAHITQDHADHEPSEPRLRISPCFELVDKRTRGHLFVRFETQLTRAQCATTVEGALLSQMDSFMPSSA